MKKSHGFSFLNGFPHLILVIGFFVLLISSDTFAQEHSFGKEEAEHSINFESGGHHESEGIQSKVTQPDSLTLYRPMIARPRPKQSEARSHEDEDALKFNFLYFIIQKFKFSDIIE